MNRSVLVRRPPPELAPEPAVANAPVTGRFSTRAWLLAALLLAALAAGLTGADLARYEAVFRRKVSPACADWLEHGRLGAGEPKSLPD